MLKAYSQPWLRNTAVGFVKRRWVLRLFFFNTMKIIWEIHVKIVLEITIPFYDGDLLLCFQYIFQIKSPKRLFLLCFNTSASFGLIISELEIRAGQRTMSRQRKVLSDPILGPVEKEPEKCRLNRESTILLILILPNVAAVPGVPIFLHRARGYMYNKSVD